LAARRPSQSGNSSSASAADGGFLTRHS
jgi:hypothetical protein